jgi:hypothetical protein
VGCATPRIFAAGQRLQPHDIGAEDRAQQRCGTGGEIAQREQAQLVELVEQVGCDIRQVGDGQRGERRGFGTGG